MEDINAIVNELVEDIDTPADIPVSYEVWAIGYDKEDQVTDAELLLATFEDPDSAVHHAKELTLADVINFAASDEYDISTEIYYIHIEVETVVPDGDDGAMNVGTIYKKTIEVFEELPEYVVLSDDDFVLLNNGDITVPKSILAKYGENDCFTAIFEDGGVSQPMIYRIKSVTDELYICEFV